MKTFYMFTTLPYLLPTLLLPRYIFCVVFLLKQMEQVSTPMVIKRGMKLAFLTVFQAKNIHT